MKTLKRIAVVLVAFVIVELVALSFKGNDIMDRSIILGLGVDKKDDDILLTAEIVSPGNGSEQVGTYSKIVSAKGASLGEALSKISEQTGKEASLGQCVFVVLGQEYFENHDFSDTIDYLINSNSFKESSTISCCQGSAQQLLNSAEALSRSVSLSLVRMLREQAQNVGIPSNVLLDYTRSQRELYKTGYLNYIRYVPSQNTDTENPDKPQGYFLYDQVCIFKQNKYVCTLSTSQTKGFALLYKKTSGDTFVSDNGGNKQTVTVNDKKVDVKLKDDAINVDVKLFVRLARADSTQTGGIFASKNQKEISQGVMQDVQLQASSLVQEFLQLQQEKDFDIVNFHEAFRQKHGTTQYIATLPMLQIPVSFTVTLTEK